MTDQDQATSLKRFEAAAEILLTSLEVITASLHGTEQDDAVQALEETTTALKELLGQVLQRRFVRDTLDKLTQESQGYGNYDTHDVYCSRCKKTHLQPACIPLDVTPRELLPYVRDLLLPALPFNIAHERAAAICTAIAGVKVHG